MIHLDLSATMECVEKDCGARLGVKLALGAMGNMMPRMPHGHGWQIGVTENGAFVCRCPAHHTALIEAPQPKIGDLIAARNAKH